MFDTINSPLNICTMCVSRFMATIGLKCRPPGGTRTTARRAGWRVICFSLRTSLARTLSLILLRPLLQVARFELGALYVRLSLILTLDSFAKVATTRFTSGLTADYFLFVASCSSLPIELPVVSSSLIVCQPLIGSPVTAITLGSA